MPNKKELNYLISELIRLKDCLKYELGMNWSQYDCINKACNILENLAREQETKQVIL